jgi:DNA-binding response OmpR family regulator
MGGFSKLPLRNSLISSKIHRQFLWFGRHYSCCLRAVFMRRKVLVVEDDPDQLEVTRLSLKAAGFAIGTATNGIDALKKAQTVSPDLILLDVMMPGLNGFAVCETLRENPATASIPILMLTGLCSHISQLVAFESGATDYLIKPFVPEELISKVEKLLSRTQRLQAYHKNPRQNNSQPHKAQPHKRPPPALADGK